MLRCFPLAESACTRPNAYVTIRNGTQPVDTYAVAPRPIEFGSCAARNHQRLLALQSAGLIRRVPKAKPGNLRASRNGAKTHLSRNKIIICLRETVMIKWAIIFFIVSLVAGFFGFSGVAEGSRTIAKILFYIALAIFLIVLVFGVMLGMLVF